MDTITHSITQAGQSHRTDTLRVTIVLLDRQMEQNFSASASASASGRKVRSAVGHPAYHAAQSADGRFGEAAMRQSGSRGTVVVAPRHYGLCLHTAHSCRLRNLQHSTHWAPKRHSPQSAPRSATRTKRAFTFDQSTVRASLFQPLEPIETAQSGLERAAAMVAVFTATMRFVKSQTG